MNKNIIDAPRRSDLTTAPLTASLARGAMPIIPEAFRLPRQGQRDPYFGLSRAWYYEAEKAGLLKLIRLRKRGNLRGVTLVPFEAVAELVRQAAEDAE